MPKPTEVVGELSADLSRDHKLATRVEVLRDELVVETLGVTTEAVTIDGSVTLDANAAVRGRFDLSIVATDDLIPMSPDSLLVPYGNEVRIYRGVEMSDHIELVSLGIFRIDAASVDGTGRTISLSGQDRAARFTTADGTFETAGQTTDDSTVDEIVEELLKPVWPDIVTDLGFPTGDLPSIGYEEGGDRWDFCVQVVKAFGGELYFDRNGILVSRPVPMAATGTPVAEFSEGATLLDANRDWDRDSVYNQVIVTGESTADAATYRGAAYDNNSSSPTYIYGPFGRKTLFWPNAFIFSDDQADNAARGVLARTMGAPDIVSFAAVPDPARNPGDVVRVTREAIGLTYDHVIDSLTIPLGHAGTMTATTRAANLVV